MICAPARLVITSEALYYRAQRIPWEKVTVDLVSLRKYGVWMRVFDLHYGEPWKSPRTIVIVAPQWKEFDRIHGLLRGMAEQAQGTGDDRPFTF